MIENIRGNIQISCYVKRGHGMGQLELMTTTAMVALNTMYAWDETVA